MLVCRPPVVVAKARAGTPPRIPRPFVMQLVVCVASSNTLRYLYGRAATGEGRVPVRGCELVCEFLIHRGFIGGGL